VLSDKIGRFFVEFVLLLFNFAAIYSLDINQVYLRDAFPVTSELAINLGYVENEFGFIVGIEICFDCSLLEIYHLMGNLSGVSFVKVLCLVKKL
jgi:hypothetical protein